MTILDKLLKNSTIKETDILSKSNFFNDKTIVSTSVPMINIALSGSIDGGLGCGLTMLAAPSKHFKTGFALLLADAYMKKYDDAVLLFYDSEFGTPQSYFKTFNIDMDRVIHTPVTDLEELSQDITNQIKEIDKKDHVIIIIDSIGNLASLKETIDAEEGNNKVDMTRAKKLKSLFRIIGAKLTKKDIPLIAINHIYMTQEMFSKAIVSGGTGSYYNSDNIWIIGRQQDTDSSKKILEGYNFIINIEKSRYVREKSKIPITVSFKDGINKWSGLFDLALEMGYISKNGNGYDIVDQSTGELDGSKHKRDAIENNSQFWKKMFTDTDFADKIKNKYQLTNENTTILEDDIDGEESEPVSGC